eukprot:UN03943
MPKKKASPKKPNTKQKQKLATSQKTAKKAKKTVKKAPKKEEEYVPSEILDYKFSLNIEHCNS